MRYEENLDVTFKTLLCCLLIKTCVNRITQAINLAEKIDVGTELARKGKLIIMTFSHSVLTKGRSILYCTSLCWLE